jgi:hypothetical protein
VAALINLSNALWLRHGDVRRYWICQIGHSDIRLGHYDARRIVAIVEGDADTTSAIRPLLTRQEIRV